MRISITDAEARGFRKELRRLREEASLSPEELGGIVDCSGQHLRNIECGSKKPSPKLAESIASVFGVQVSDMFDPVLNESPDERKEYGNKLFAARMRKGLKRSVVAGALGIPDGVYLEFERGECSISPHQKVLLDKLLDIDKKVEAAPPAPVIVKREYVPTDVCDLILEHVKDLQIDIDSQKRVWRYFTDLKIDAEERRLFGKEGA